LVLLVGTETEREEENLEEPTVPPVQAPPKGGRRGPLIAVIAVLVVVIVAISAYVALQAAPRAKFAVDLWYNNDGHYGDTETAVAAVLQNSIERCGRVEVTLKSDPWAVYRTNWVNGRMDLFLLGWYPDYFDSDDYVSPFLGIAGAKSLGSFYNNSQVDTWIREEQTTTDPTVRADRFSKVQDALAADVPYVPLWSGTAQVAYVSGVQNVVDATLHPVSVKWSIVNKPGATELKVSTNDKIISLDPASAYDFFSIEMINQIFDTLLVYDAKTATLLPGLATEVPTVANGGVSAEGKTYTYHLKAGVKFHDGTTLTSQIVKNSIDRVIRLDLGGSAAFLLYDVGGLTANHKGGSNTAAGVIDTPDAQTIVFHLVQPVSFFNDLMAFSVSAPVPSSYSATGEQPSTVGSVVGTGPYRLTGHTPNTQVVLEKFADYYGPNLYGAGIGTVPKMDKVTINIRSSAAALKQDIETKNVDVVFRTLTPADLADLQVRKGALGIAVDVGSSPQIRYLVFNVNRVQDVRARQAIAYSVDRSVIDSIVFLGQVTPLYSMLPPALPYSKPVFTSYGDANCGAANGLLAQLGFTVWLRGQLLARDT